MISTQPVTPDCLPAKHEQYGGCYACCSDCNYDRHDCPACGTGLHHNSTDYSGKRHWLSDCRPDLVEHEVGPLCTWWGLADRTLGDKLVPDCFAYQDPQTREWTDRHVHFSPDGPMA